MFISLVRASEAAGKMSEMLSVLSRYLDAEAQTRKQVKGAMIYPFHYDADGRSRPPAR